VSASCDKEEAIKMNDKKTLMSPTFPFAPFLLTSLKKEGGRNYFVIDTWEGMDLEVLDDGKFVQSFVWTAHKANEDEIKTFLEDKDE